MYGNCCYDIRLQAVCGSVLGKTSPLVGVTEEEWEEIVQEIDNAFNAHPTGPCSSKKSGLLWLPMLIMAAVPPRAIQ